MGRVGIDFVIARDCDGGWREYAIEINLRDGGTTHSFGALRLLTGGSYDPERSEFTTASGARRFYHASDDLENRAWTGTNIDRVNEAAAQRRLLYDPAREAGAVFHMGRSLASEGRVGVTAIGASRRQTERIFAGVVGLLNELADRERARLAGKESTRKAAGPASGASSGDLHTLSLQPAFAMTDQAPEGRDLMGTATPGYPPARAPNSGRVARGKVNGDPSDCPPLIGIAPWRRHLPTFLGERTELDTLHPPYGDRIAEAGGLPWIVPRPPSHLRDKITSHILDRLDGLVLSGGGDIDPAFYGEANTAALLVDADADAWEISLVRSAAQRGLPTLGVCRGAQIMAVAFGGRLIQDLPPESEHGDLLELSPEEALADRHWVDVLPGTRLRAVLGAPRLYVNTIHHHAVADPGRLAVAATAAGELIEAVEPQRELADWPALGVQWHPEKLDDRESQALFEQFTEAAAAFQTRRNRSVSLV
jgi:putative glutamine amidotransferase